MMFSYNKTVNGDNIYEDQVETLYEEQVSQIIFSKPFASSLTLF